MLAVTGLERVEAAILVLALTLALAPVSVLTAVMALGSSACAFGKAAYLESDAKSLSGCVKDTLEVHHQPNPPLLKSLQVVSMARRALEQPSRRNMASQSAP